MEKYQDEIKYAVNKMNRINSSMYDVMSNDRNHYFTENIKANIRCAELMGLLMAVIKNRSIELQQRKVILDLLISIITDPDKQLELENLKNELK